MNAPDSGWKVPRPRARHHDISGQEGGREEPPGLQRASRPHGEEQHPCGAGCPPAPLQARRRLSALRDNCFHARFPYASIPTVQRNRKKCLEFQGLKNLPRTHLVSESCWRLSTTEMKEWMLKKAEDLGNKGPELSGGKGNFQEIQWRKKLEIK